MHLIQILLNDNGQDLIEYALVVALIAFAATVGMNNVDFLCFCVDTAEDHFYS